LNSESNSSEHKNNKKHRRLSCIMFTDMVGYSALTQKNEMLAIDLLQEQKRLLRPIFLNHNGREIEVIGDAFFVEFESALEGVGCAIEIQKLLHERNEISGIDNKITLRIGLHVGDVIHVGDRVHGDGVNIAARLEPLAKPGGVCISEDVARQVHNKIDLPLEKQTITKLKNIEHAVEIFHIVLPWETVKKSLSNSTSINNFTKKIAIIFGVVLAIITLITLVLNLLGSKDYNNKRIAVLPLKNISNNTEDEYFSDGLTEELISQLAKISGLSVIAKTSVLRFQSEQTKLKEIGNELAVGTILTGSVRTSDNKARISVQLINVENMENIWTADYNRELKDIFEIQSGIAISVANELKVKLHTGEENLIRKEVTNNPNAYKNYLLGLSNLNRRTMKSVYASLDYFKEAANLDTNYAQAYVGIADCYTLISAAGYGSLSQTDANELANIAISRALEIDNSSAEAYNSLGYINLRLQWDWVNAENNFKKAIKLKPNYSKAHERYALLLALLGRNKESLVYMKRAYELDPLSASVSTGLGRVYHFSRQFEKAIDQFKLTLNIHPNYAEAEFALGLSLVQVKRYREAIQYLKGIVKKSKNRFIYYSALGHAYAFAGNKDEAKQNYNKLKELSNEEDVSPLYFAIIDAALGNKTKAIDLLYEAYEQHFGILVYIKSSPFYDPLKSDQRFQKLQKLIGFN
jgi:adenylate cyclase